MEDNKVWFKNAKFGMMIHWGLYSVLAGEYKGRLVRPVTSEWIMSWLNIPIKEYEKIAQAFCPIYFDAEEWVKLALNAGMTYLVVTAKHHDGFAMYHSAVDKYNIYDFTPFKRDVLKELSEACKKNGLKFGVYYSQELDWHEENGGGYSVEKDIWEGKSWSNNWDFPNKKQKNFTLCYEKKIKPQVKELMTQYGDIDMVWFDCPTDISLEQSRELFDMVKLYQPNCLINTRIGNGLGDYGSAEDNDLSAQSNRALFEVPATLNDTWGFNYYDHNWKSVNQIVTNLNELNSRGINYLLNLGPDYLGRIPTESANILLEVGKIIKSKQ